MLFFNQHVVRLFRFTILCFCCLLIPASSLAHPMGNFSISHYAGIGIQQGSVEISYLVDMAEIPTFQEFQQSGIKANPDEPATRSYLMKQAEILKQGLVVTLNGHALALRTQSAEVIFPPGAGGLPTMKLGFVFVADISALRQAGADRLQYALYYRDDNFPNRVGWKEIVANASSGIDVLNSSVSSTDRSSRLSNYPTGLLNSPPRDLEARIKFALAVAALSERNSLSRSTVHSGQPSPHKAGALGHPARTSRPPVPGIGVEKRQPISENRDRETTLKRGEQKGQIQSSFDAIGLAANRQATPQNRFTELMTSRQFGFWFLFAAAAIAAGLGALHALEPGHGKTIVAAYLVGSRGTARHAVLLGLVVTAAHTAGVYLLGAVTLYASRYIVPEQLYPWLGVISGLSVTGIGVFIFLRHVTGATADHSHSAGASHSHWFSSLRQSQIQNPPLRDANQPENTISLRELFALGITGGIVPCPAALVVLLSAFSLHRVGFGLFLITAFSLGLALVLVVVGLMMVYAKRFMSRVLVGGSMLQYLPALSSAFMVVLGLGIAVSAFSSANIGNAFLTRDKLIPFVTVVLLGLFLGMRHSTDPDHVVAVSTIISREGSIRHSALIGLLWGLGHTLTIFLVGSAIIVFGVIIPPRLGLSMEFSVGVMLILLGAMNLSGVTQWIKKRFGRAQSASEPSEIAATPKMDLRGSMQPEFQRAGRIEKLLYQTVGRFGLYQTVRPLAVGVVHGLAGSAAVALLVLSTIRSPLWATAYLLVFGAGTMIGMMLMTAVISLPFAYTGRRFLRANQYIITASGVISVVFGLFVVYQIGLVQGLFASQPHWIPR